MQFVIHRSSDIIAKEPPCSTSYTREGATEYQVSWVIDICTLEELIAFKEEEGTLILSKEDDLNSIEIYDAYRE